MFNEQYAVPSSEKGKDSRCKTQEAGVGGEVTRVTRGEGGGSASLRASSVAALFKSSPSSL